MRASLTSFFTRLLPILLVCVGRASGAVCPILESGQILKIVLSSDRAACFVVNVAVGEATEIAVTQPVDLAIRLRSGAASILADGFEFGTETATVEVAGRYSIEVSPVSDARMSPVTVVMSRKALPLQQAKILREAEDWAAASKRSGKAGDIVESLRRWEAVGDTSAVARTWLKQGDAVLGNGELAGAREAYENALELCHSVSDIRCAAEAENNSGFISQQLGEFETSLARLTAAAQDWRRVGDRISEGRTLSNLGLLFRQTSDYQKAISLYEQAENILGAGDALANARVLNNLGLCYQYLAEYGKARNYFERALAIETSRPSGAKDALAARLNLGRNSLLDGKPANAKRLLDPALLDAAARKDRSAMATALNNLGQVLLAIHLPAEARTKLAQALDLHQAMGDKRLAASDLHFLGVAAAADGRIESARDLFAQAIRIRREALLRDAAADSLFSLADLERSAGDPGAARDYAEQALALLESVRRQVPGAALRASFYSQKRRFFDLLLETVVVPENPHAAEDGLLVTERGRGRALLDLLAEGSIPDLLPKDLLLRRVDVQRRIDLVSDRITVATGERERALRDQAETLVAEDEEIEAEFRQTIAAQPLGQPLMSVEKLQREYLPHDCALLEFHLGQRESYLWLVKPNSVQMFPLPPRSVVEAQAGRAVELFRAILDRRRSPAKQAEFERAIRTLSGTLLGQLNEAELPNRLIVVPDGALYRLPFAALRLPSTRRSLGLARDLIQIPAAAYLGAGRKPRKVSAFPEALLAVADPVFSTGDPRVVYSPSGKQIQGSNLRTADANLARLPFSAELDAAALLIPTSRRKILRGFDAAPLKLRQLRLQDFAVLHFSTHALIDDQIPELSRIALSMVDRSGAPVDGFLRPYQFSEFHLDGSTVVLSACDTALGKAVLGEGLTGFTASLLHAGAAQILLTLADVDAEGSSEFLKETYQILFSPGDTSMEHALTLARRNLSQSARWSDPYYWASLVLYGRPADSP
jgi:CHAT domain-containing protein/Tfp pilus assembly protein PilF